LSCGLLLAAGTVPSRASSIISTGNPTIAATGSISGFVFNDLNGNNIKDPGEPGIPGVLVFLLQGQVFITEVPTDGSGHYFYGSLVSGDYTVGTKPPDCPASPGNQGFVGLTLGDGQNVEVDFGYECPGPPPPPPPGCTSCALRYPHHSNDPRASAVFNARC